MVSIDSGQEELKKLTDMSSRSKRGKTVQRKTSIDARECFEELRSISINDTHWRCMISMMCESSMEDRRYLDLFAEAAEDGERRSICHLSQEKITRNAKIVAKKDPLGCSPAQRICHLVQKTLDEDGEDGMNARLTSKLIKYFVSVEKEAQVDASRQRRLFETETSRWKSEKQNRAPIKLGTKLKRRGEKYARTTYIDDAPLQGPDLYVLLSGFYDPHLPIALVDEGLPLSAIIKLHGFSTKDSPSIASSSDSAEDVERGSAPTILGTVSKGSQFSKFWTTLDDLLRDKRFIVKFHGVTSQIFCPRQLPTATSEEDVQMLQKAMYDKISFLLYDLYDLSRQHANYIRNMKLQSNLEEVTSGKENLQGYKTTMSEIPQECDSIPLILHILLSQVAGNYEDSNPDETRSRTRLESDQQLDSVSVVESLLNEIITKVYGEGNVESDSIVTRKLLKVIVQGNALEKSTYHWSNLLDSSGQKSLELAGLAVLVLRQSKVSLLWSQVPKLGANLVKMYKYHVRQLRNCFEARINDEAIGHYLHLLVFEKLMKPTEDATNCPWQADEGWNLTRSPNSSSEGSIRSVDAVIDSGAESYNRISYPRAMDPLFECPELVDLTDFMRVLPSKVEPDAVEGLDDMHFREYTCLRLLPSEVFLQVFNECSLEFENMESRYFAPTDSMLLCFYDLHGSDGLVKSKFAAHIATAVCFRDFCDYVLDEESEWLENEEKKYEVRSANASKSSIDAPEYSDEFFVLPNSLKATAGRLQERDPQRNPKLLQDPEESDPTASKPKLNEEKVDVPSSFQRRRSAEEAEPSYFLGYDLGHHRVQISGAQTKFCSPDGTSVRVCLEEWLYGKSQLQINVSRARNELILYSVPGTSLAIAHPYSFHFTTFNGIVISFPNTLLSRFTENSWNSKKPDEDVDRASTSNVGVPANKKSSSCIANQDRLQHLGFHASWPSGLVVENVSGVCSPYIKQTYLIKGPECEGISGESYRIFTQHGEIIVFYNDGTVRVLRSNAVDVRITDLRRQDDTTTVTSPTTPSNSTKKSKGMKKLRRQKSSSLAVGRPRTVSIKGRLASGILDYEVVEPSGRRYDVKDGRIVYEEDLVLTSDEQFTRRNDGASWFLDSDGCLAVSYPDGSRITTSFVVEEDPLMCDWDDAELSKYFSWGAISRMYTAGSSSRMTTGSSSSQMNVEGHWEEIIAEILVAEAFVSVQLLSCMEHKNYATVTYDRSKMNWELLMPGNVEIHVSSDSCITVAPDPTTSLRVEKDRITLTGNCDTSRGKPSSFSVYNLDSKVPLFSITDSFGNSFTVESDGRTSCKKSSHVTGKNLEPGQEQRSVHSSSSSFCTLLQKKQQSYRLFAVKRDFTAFEYLHDSVRQAQENNALRNKDASIHFYEVPDHSDLKYCTTFVPINPLTVSQVWLRSHKVSKIESINSDSRKSLPSTYSSPWNYFIPYGRKNSSINRETRNVDVTSLLPKVVEVQVTQTLKSMQSNVIDKLQRALWCYSKKMLNRFGEWHYGFVPEESIPFEEQAIIDLALGKRKTLDAEVFIAGLENKQWKSVEKMSVNESEKDVFKSDNDEIEWYETCLKEQLVPPYFRTISGACFLWILECVDKVFSGSHIASTLSM